MIKHYVQFLFAGTFLAEFEELEVTERNPNLFEVPKGCYGYRFFDRQEVTTDDGEVLTGQKRNYSPITYFGELFTLDKIKNQYPEQRILIDNVKRFNSGKAVLTTKGNWQEYREGDIVIPESEVNYLWNYSENRKKIITIYWRT